MVKIKQGNIFGRLGQSFAKGVSEALPKEVERYRMGQGLQQLEKDSANLTPQQYFTRSLNIPGVGERPEVVRQLGQFAMQDARGRGLKNLKNENANERQPNPFPKRPEGQEPGQGVGITTPEPTTETRKPHIPLTNREKQIRAGELYENQRDLYPTPEAALAGAEAEDQSNLQRSIAIQAQRQGEENVQSKLINEMDDAFNRANVKIPDNVRTKLRDEAFDKLKTGKYSEFDVANVARKEADKISRQYDSIKGLGTMKLLKKSSSGNRDSLRSLQKDFAKRDDLENFADTVQTENNLSPSKAQYVSFFPEQSKGVNNIFRNLPTAVKVGERNTFKNFPNLSNREQFIAGKTLDVSKKIAPQLKSEDSLLSIAEQLKAKGYDPREWLRFVDSKRDDLKLTERQGRELGKSRDFTPTVDDLWLFYLNGLDHIVEEK